jgi:hypothetical protein
LACEHGIEGIVSKRINGRYEPDRRSVNAGENVHRRAGIKMHH